MNDQMIYISTDGDDAGKSVGQAAMSNDEQALTEAGQRIEAGQTAIENWVLQSGGQKISMGGDEGVFKIPASASENLDSLRTDYSFASGLTLTIGVGNTLSDANKALLAGKARGKNQIAQYEPIVDHELQDEHMDDSAAETENEVPETTSTAESDDQYDHEHTDDCQYCAPAEDHAHTDNCQYCAASEAAPTHEHTDDCQYCQAAEADDHEHTDDCQYCAQMSEPDHEHTDNCEYCAKMGQPTPEQSGDILTSEIDNGTPGQPSSDDVNSIDESNMPVDNSMEQNVSRPDGYSGEVEAQPQDDGQPNMTDVLQGNLDQQGEQIAKEKVIALVGQALEGFKANKRILEKAKEQAPELYTSTIAMLRAMIEMAKMLGLKSNQDQPEETSQTPQAPQGQAPQAAPPEGAAQAPKAQSQLN